MKVFEVKVTWKYGLHARQAARLAVLARSMNSRIEIKKENLRVSATRIVDLIELNAQMGEALEIRLCGGNEEENAERLKALFGDE